MPGAGAGEQDHRQRMRRVDSGGHVERAATGSTSQREGLEQVPPTEDAGDAQLRRVRRRVAQMLEHTRRIGEQRERDQGVCGDEEPRTRPP
jgi:hypothetical protein